MRTLIVGHRGVGKTSLLKRIKYLFPAEIYADHFFDLDQEIETISGRKISQIFSEGNNDKAKENDKVNENKENGEIVFRRLEREAFESIQSRTQSNANFDLNSDFGSNVELLSTAPDAKSLPVYVVAGGGFDPSLADDSWRVLWLRRNSDKNGRIFLDRPRLNNDLDPLDEYRLRYKERDLRFRTRVDETLWIDEGLGGVDGDQSDPDETQILNGTISNLNGALTVLPEHFVRRSAFRRRLINRIKWGIRWIELRDDLLTLEQMEWVIGFLPLANILVSFRSRSVSLAMVDLVNRNELAFDWPVEFESDPVAMGLTHAPTVLSLHERRAEEGIESCLARLHASAERFGFTHQTILKAALPVANFAELEQGHKWTKSLLQLLSSYQTEGLHQKKMVFLPMSDDGRWYWFRLLHSFDYPLNFIREDEGSGPDQPTLLQWLRYRRISHDQLRTLEFAAVLGDPVHCSRTPMRHMNTFANRGQSVFAIRVFEKEWHQALPILFNLGLRWAAVTAPLKKLAYQSCLSCTARADQHQSVNTLIWRHNGALAAGWIGDNTDLPGLQDAVAQIQFSAPVAIWGGGGTLPIVKSVFPKAVEFSARSGTVRTSSQAWRGSSYSGAIDGDECALADTDTDIGASFESFLPTTVVWSVGSGREGLQVPPSEWRPRLVIDLNYFEDSPGREYAASVGAEYFSGLTMFEAQAQKQSEFWHLPSHSSHHSHQE
jgi:shikimate 5-dehydrogenase